MTKRVWLTGAAPDLTVTKTDPVSIGLNVTVTVRGADENVVFDGVWLNGEPSYDTYVIVNDEVRFHSPVESAAGTTFELHEAAGGGWTL